MKEEPVVQDLPASQVILTASPNPFNPTVTLSFTIPVEGVVTLSIYDVRGRRVDTLVDAHTQKGIHTTTWDGTGHASGTYFARIQTQNTTETVKVSLVK